MTRKMRAVALLSTLTTPLLLYFILRTAAVALNPAYAVGLPPRDTTFVLPSLVRSLSTPGARVTPEITELARRGAVGAPLAYEPYFLFAKEAEARGQIGRAIPFMEEAKRRRPNALLTRLHLLAYYGRVRRFPFLLREMDFVLRKSEDARRIVLPELVKLVSDPQARAALAGILAKRPLWREEFFRTVQGRDIRPADALALLNLVRAQSNGDLTLERGLYFQSLAAAGDYGKARNLWLETLPAAERERHFGLFDGEFRGIKAGPPFTWKFHDGEMGRAEIISNGPDESYLGVEYFGRGNALLAEQTLALAPGTYRLVFTARAPEDSSAELAMLISCLPSSADLTKSALSQLPKQLKQFSVDFRVPTQGCAGQWLRLTAGPGERSGGIVAQIGRMEIIRAH